MEYNDKQVSIIVLEYFSLRESLQKLEEAKKDKDGVVLSYVSEHYVNATKIVEFLKETPAFLQEYLKLSELEKELNTFSNKNVFL